LSTIAERLTAALDDRHHIERELGQGGMATVYLAEDLKHDRKVPIKVLKPELAAERFEPDGKDSLKASARAGGFLAGERT
jgi:serine/threonine protein kinase